MDLGSAMVRGARFDRLNMRTCRANNDVDGNGPKRFARRKGFERAQRRAFRIHRAHENKNALDASIAYPPPRRRKLRTKQRVARADQATRRSRNERRVAILSRTLGVLIEKKIAFMRSIGEIVDDHDLGGAIAQYYLPTRIERVMIDDQPVDVPAERREGSLGVGAPAPGQPIGMGSGPSFVLIQIPLDHG